MNAIETQGPVAFWTAAYGAHRWDKYLFGRHGTWLLVSKSTEFDFMRGMRYDAVHITCVVDDFGDLVRVPA